MRYIIILKTMSSQRDAAARLSFCGSLNASNIPLRHYRARHILNFRRVKYNLLSLREISNFQPVAIISNCAV